MMALNTSNTSTSNTSGSSLGPGVPSTSRTAPPAAPGTIRVDKNDPRVRDYRQVEFEGSTFWKCMICFKHFKHLYLLTRHIPVHTDVRNFKCPLCDKSFRQQCTLAQHKLIHSKARRFVCELCTKSFTRGSSLAAHMETHTKQFKHVCDVCGRGFHQKGNFQNHKFTHTNERPFKCEWCNRGFNQQSNLVQHQKLCHQQFVKTFVCQSCPKTFKQANAFKAHLDAHCTPKPLLTLDSNDNLVYYKAAPPMSGTPSAGVAEFSSQPSPLPVFVQPLILPLILPVDVKTEQDQLAVRVAEDGGMGMTIAKRRRHISIPSVEHSPEEGARFLNISRHLSVPNTSNEPPASCNFSLPVIIEHTKEYRSYLQTYTQVYTINWPNDPETEPKYEEGDQNMKEEVDADESLYGIDDCYKTYLSVILKGVSQPHFS